MKLINYEAQETHMNVILFENILNDLMKLYVKKDGGFSYFIGKSQTH